jgi:hypothetical protein
VILKFLASSIALAVVIGLSVVGIVGPAAATGDVEYVEVNNDGSISG